MPSCDGRRRVVVTGLGAVTPLGAGVEPYWESLCSGRSGVGPITLWDASKYRVRIAAEVPDWNPEPSLGERQARRLDRVAQFGLCAALEAWKQSGLADAALDSYEVGVVLGSSHGGEISLLTEVEDALHARRVSPRLIPRMLGNMTSAAIAIHLGLRGPTFGLESACATGGHAIGEASEIIRRGDATVMVCGGADAAVTPLTISGDFAAGALSRRNDHPRAASRPFDRDRDGFVLGEGAGVVVLEEREHAQNRGATILAEISGYAATADAHHETRPDATGEAAAHATRRAVGKAGLHPEDLTAIFAHATGTRLGDAAEAIGLHLGLGEAAHRIPVTATKSSIGHLFAGAGAVQIVAAVQALVNGVLPPTLNLEHRDPTCDLNVVTQIETLQGPLHILSNSFGFGGHNASLVLSEQH